MNDTDHINDNRDEVVVGVGHCCEEIGFDLIEILKRIRKLYNEEKMTRIRRLEKRDRMVIPLRIRSLFSPKRLTVEKISMEKEGSWEGDTRNEKRRINKPSLNTIIIRL